MIRWICALCVLVAAGLLILPGDAAPSAESRGEAEQKTIRFEWDVPDTGELEEKIFRTGGSAQETICGASCGSGWCDCTVLDNSGGDIFDAIDCCVGTCDTCDQIRDRDIA